MSVSSSEGRDRLRDCRTTLDDESFVVGDCDCAVLGWTGDCAADLTLDESVVCQYTVDAEYVVTGVYILDWVCHSEA